MISLFKDSRCRPSSSRTVSQLIHTFNFTHYSNRSKSDKQVVFSIWNHLVHLSEERGRTILITTHYYDEAKKSTMVGIMRHGSLLVEQDPKQILQNFNSTSLETVVLELCKKDGIDNDQVGGCVGGDKAKITYDVESPNDTKCKLKLKTAKFLIQINLSKKIQLISICI